MSKVVKITAPLNNVNDDSVVVFEFLVENNSRVRKGQEVLSIETSKTTVALTSEIEGEIRFLVNEGDEVPNGTVLAIIAEDMKDLDSYVLECHEDNKLQDLSYPKIDSYPLNAISNARLIEPVKVGVFDTPMTMGEIMVMDGTRVAEGDTICNVRGVQGIQQVKASTEGYLFWIRKNFETIPIGEPAGYISNENARWHEETDELTIAYDSIRVSKAARKLLDERKLDAQKLGMSGLIRESDILTYLGEGKKEKSVRKQQQKNIVQIEERSLSGGQYTKIDKTKKTEGRLLGLANRDAVVSQVSVLVPTKAIFETCSREPDLAKRYSSVVIFETARLLKKYRIMCSRYDEGNLFVYDKINIGYALSIDEGLRVPVFRNSDQLDLDEIVNKKEEYIERYINGTLNTEDLGEGTFTITDLSSTGCYLFNPVLNYGQSAILGIGGMNTTGTEYPLILAFDHRVMDGSMATAFLCELKMRLIAHEKVILESTRTVDEPSENLSKENDIAQGKTQNLPVVEDICCDFCYRSIDEVISNGHYLFKVVGHDGTEKHLCSICAKGW